MFNVGVVDAWFVDSIIYCLYHSSCIKYKYSISSVSPELMNECVKFDCMNEYIALADKKMYFVET